MESIELLQNTIRWLKENPDHWIRYHASDGHGNYCAMGAMRMIAGDVSILPTREFQNIQKKISPYLSAAGCELYGNGSPAGINDYQGYDAILSVFELALKKAIDKDLSWIYPNEEILATQGGSEVGFESLPE